jgi:hypothetical protein
MSGTPNTVSEAVDRVALVATLLALLMYGINGDYELPDPMHFAGLIVAIAGLAAVVMRQRWAGAFTLLAVLIFGLREHAIQGDRRSSDDMLATNEAVNVLFSGHNPYAHTYLSTNPPGSPMGYPSGEILFYGLAHLGGLNVFRVDLTCGILILGLIGALAPFCGTGLAAFGIALIGWEDFITHRLTDGSNDNAAAFLVLAGFTLLLWARSTTGRASGALWWTSAFAFGWALAFKEYSAPVLLFVALFLWREDAHRARDWIAAALGTAIVMVLPFFLWNPRAFIENVGGELLVHTNFWGRNVWHDVVHLIPGTDALGPIVPLVVLVASAALTVLLWRRPTRTLGAALLQGVVIVCAVFVLARWTTSTYYIFLLPLAIAAAITSVGSEYATAD